MTNSAALPPTGDAVTAMTPGTPAQTIAGDTSGPRDRDIARAQIAAMQASAMTKVIGSLSDAGTTVQTKATSARSHDERELRRAERMPESKHDPTDPAVARARAAEAELRTEMATYEGVRRAVAEAREAAERVAEPLASRQNTPAGADRDDRTRRHRAAEKARVEFVRDELSAAAQAARSEAAESLRRANELAAIVADENARTTGRRGRTPGMTEGPRGSQLAAEVEAAVIELARVVGAITEARADGRLTVTIGDRPLVERGVVHSLELHDLTESPPGGARNGTEREPPATAGRSLEVAWSSGRPAREVGGTLAGHLNAVNVLLPRASLVLEEIAAVARTDAAQTPSASDLLDEFGVSLAEATSRAARRLDVASAVAAITAGPPPGFLAAVIASAGERAPGSLAQLAAKASQQLVSDLQKLSERTTGLQDAALHLARNTPFVPVRVTSSDPSAVRVDTPWPSAGLLRPTSVADLAASEVTGFDPDAIAAPLDLTLSVVSVARGDVVMSRGGVPAGVDITAGLPVTLVIGTSPPGAQPGEESGISSPIGEVIVSAPVTISAVAEAINAAASAASPGTKPVGTVSAGTQRGADGLTHLIVESDHGPAWVVALRADGTPRDVLGGFSLLAARTHSLVVATGAGLGWSGSSEDRSIEGPLPGLGLTLSTVAEGTQVTLRVEPALEEVTDAVDELITGVRDVLAAAGAAEPHSATAELATTTTVRDPAVLERSIPNVPAAGTAALPAPAVAAPPLGSDPAIMDLAAAYVAAISGASTSDRLDTSTAEAVAAVGAQETGARGIPGLSVEVVESGRRRLVFDREAFARALIDEPAGTRNAVRAAAAETAGVAREALDGRVGLLAVRLHTELAAAREIDVRAAAPDWSREQREIEVARRAEALTGLLKRLDAESRWLGGQLA